MIRWNCLLIVVISFFLLLVTSCEKFSGDQTVPAYLDIDSIYLSTDYYTQGTNSQKITDAWVAVDDVPIGAFELPARFPVLNSGKHKVSVYPGIKKNGIAATRTIYSFYNPVVKELTLTPDSTTRLGVLKSTYQSTTVFPWKEDFDQAGSSLDTTNRSTAWVQRTASGSPQTFEGAHSALIVLDSVHDFFEAASHDASPIPMAPVYLELNFNTTNSLKVGVYTYGTASVYQTAIITLKPTDGAWKKIYVDLTTTLNAYSGMTNYRVYFGTFKDAGLAQSTILLDNIKVVTRQAK
jgi:hypothetical protein